MTRVVDSDQHLYESRSLWADHIAPGSRDDALGLVDDERGYTWLSWRGAHLGLADVHLPGNTASCGEHRNRQRAGEPASYRYDDALPAAYWQPGSRLRWLDEAGLDEAVLFPNYGLLWERRLSSSLPALTANMTAWNRWCAIVRDEGGGRLHPVAHLTLRDPEWLEAELDTLAGAGVTLAMIGAGPVDGRDCRTPSTTECGRRSSTTPSRRCSTSPIRCGSSTIAGIRTIRCRIWSPPPRRYFSGCRRHWRCPT